MDLKEAVKTLWEWRYCTVGQVWAVAAFPREALAMICPNLDSAYHRYLGIDALIRKAIIENPVALADVVQGTPAPPRSLPPVMARESKKVKE